MNASKLVLGTAQLGMEYGIANRHGRPGQERVEKIVREAWSGGIRKFDTAQAYGESEKALGEAFRALGYTDDVLVISKFDPGLDHLSHSEMTGALDASLERLGVPSLFGVMLHGDEPLSLWNQGLGDVLRAQKTSGKVKHIGVSVYTPEMASLALGKRGIDMLQIPANILDRRFERAGILDLAMKKNAAVYIRSVFLQGLFLIDKNRFPKKMQFARPVMEKVETVASQLGLEKHELALAYIRQKIPAGNVIFGADSPEQVKKNVRAWDRNGEMDVIPLVEEAFNGVDERILRPDRWPA